MRNETLAWITADEAAQRLSVPERCIYDYACLKQLRKQSDGENETP